MIFTPSLASAFFCPPRPGKPPSNNVVGTIEKINEPDAPFPVPLHSVRIWVDGTNHFTGVSREGRFFLTDIGQDRIILRFEYLGERLYLDLGEIGWDNTVVIEGIVLGNKTAKYAKRSIQPFKADH